MIKRRIFAGAVVLSGPTAACSLAVPTAHPAEHIRVDGSSTVSTAHHRGRYHLCGLSSCNGFDVLCFESLNLKGMQRLWRCKVHDLAFREFLQVLEWVATQKGKRVVSVDRWFPSSQTCSSCGSVLEHLDLETRHWRCPACSAENDHDEHAALNIKMAGASAFGLGDVRRALPAVAAGALTPPFSKWGIQSKLPQSLTETQSPQSASQQSHSPLRF